MEKAAGGKTNHFKGELLLLKSILSSKYIDKDEKMNEEDKKKEEQEGWEKIKSMENMEKDADGELLWNSKVEKVIKLGEELEVTVTSYTRSKKRPRAVPFTDKELEAESKKESKKKPLTKQEIKQQSKRELSRKANLAYKDNKKRRVEWLENNTVGGSGEKKCKRGCGKPIPLCDCPDRKA